MEKRRIRTMSMMISFKPAGLLHAPILSIYECFLMLYNLSTYPQSIRIPSSNMFRKLTFPSSQVDCILSSKYTPYNFMFFSLVAKDSHEQRYHPYGSTNLSQNALEEKNCFVFQNDVIVAGPDVQSGYLYPNKKIITTPPAFETCPAMKGKIRCQEENQIQHMSGPSVWTICLGHIHVSTKSHFLSILLPVHMSDAGNMPLELHRMTYLISCRKSGT